MLHTFNHINKGCNIRGTQHDPLQIAHACDPQKQSFHLSGG